MCVEPMKSCADVEFKFFCSIAILVKFNGLFGSRQLLDGKIESLLKILSANWTFRHVAFAAVRAPTRIHMQMKFTRVRIIFYN